jgi:hypothetical protein
MRVSGQHGLDPMPCNLGQVGIVHASRTEVRHVGVAALVRSDVQPEGFLGRVPDIAVEVPLAPHVTPRRREDQLAVRAIQIDLGFEHPGKGRRDRDEGAGSLLAVVSLRALEDRSLMRGATDLKGLAVEVLHT